MALLIRPLTIEDTAKAVAVYADSHGENGPVEAVSAAEWERFFRQPVNDSGRGFFLAEYNGLPVSIATSSIRMTERERIRHFRIIVLPYYRRQKIGTRMLSRIVRLDITTPGVLLQCLCPGRWTYTQLFLEHWDFFRVESEVVMKLTSAPVPPVLTPAKVTAEWVSHPSDLATTVATLHNTGYRGDVSFVPYDAESMAKLLDDGVELCVLRDAGKVIGYVHAEPRENVSSIESLVVDPAYQNKGLGAWLCSVAISDQFRRHNCQEIELQVSDRNLAAMHVYRKLGFREISQMHRYRADRNVLAERISSYDDDSPLE